MRPEADPGRLSDLDLPTHRGLVIAGVSWWNRRQVAGLLAPLDQRPVMRPDVDIDAVEIAAGDGRALVAWASKLAPDVVARCSERNVPLVRIEDGFLRSVGLGAGLVSGSSYALDRRGIYYDATAPSDLEHLLEHADLQSGDIARGRRLRELIVANRLSKYNLAATPPELPSTLGRERIFVPGQVAADAAIRTTLSATVDLTGPNVNLELLRAVRRRNPKALIVYKPHPDVAKGLRPGTVTADAARGLIDVEATGADILSLIDVVDRIETLSSLSGFEALLRGKAVTVHGLPFYAGWGLTDDMTVTGRRTRQRSIDELAVLALTRYCRHVDPQSGEPISCERLAERLAGLKLRSSHHLVAELRTRISWLGRRLGL
ncbi:MAG: hypothetical protein SFW09_20265 [Hyphomicrobiaceae bacterium]|nr:hypothetical protein [Hyphomicrobiaceae bacterium]